MNKLRNYEQHYPDCEVERRYDFLRNTHVELGQIALAMAQNGLTFENKDDGTPVTPLDKLLNDEFIMRVENEFPGDRVWGEEGSNSEVGDVSDVERRWLWIVDPWDGTRKLLEAIQAGKLNQCTSALLTAAFAPGETTPTISGAYSPLQRKKLMVSASPDGAELWTPGHPSRPIIVPQGPADIDDVNRYEYSSWGKGLKKLDEMMPLARRVRTQIRMASVALGDADITVFPSPGHPHDVLPGAHSVVKAGGTIVSLKGEAYEDVDWRVDPVNGAIATVEPVLARQLVERLAA